jgi:hypothetical protein
MFPEGIDRQTTAEEIRLREHLESVQRHEETLGEGNPLLVHIAS